jgi:hypothetical protein
MFKITRDWIHRWKSGSGGWNKPQLDVLGIRWPPRAGWIAKLEGTEILDSQREEFEHLRGLTRKNLQTPKAAQSPKEKLLTRSLPAQNSDDESFLWVVLDENGLPAHVTVHKQMAHDHINDALAQRIDAGLWRVVKVQIVDEGVKP